MMGGRVRKLLEKITMDKPATVTGRCICGAVIFAGTAVSGDVTVCHCDTCRGWSSGPYFSITLSDLRFQGTDSIAKVQSSDWAERAFCRECGSSLYYHIVGSNEYQMSAGALDDLSDLNLNLQVFIDRKPSFYNFAEQTTCMDTAKVLAAFSPGPDLGSSN